MYVHPDLQTSGEGKIHPSARQHKVLCRVTSVCLHLELLEDETLSGEGKGKWITACGKTCCLAQQLCPSLLPTEPTLSRAAECWVSI